MQNSTKSSEKKNTKTVHSVAKLVVIGFSDVLELDHRFLRQLSRILYVIVKTAIFTVCLHSVAYPAILIL